jgi:hypothetical protein
VQLLSSFTDKATAALALEACWHSPVYHRALFTYIRATNETKICSFDQREIILRSLDVVLEDSAAAAVDVVDASVWCEETTAGVIVFLVAAFCELLEFNNTTLMKCIFRVLGIVAHKSEYAPDKLHTHSVFQKFIDAIFSKTSPVLFGGDTIAHNIQILPRNHNS